MESLVVVLLTAALLIQIPIALLVRFDARRQGFDNPEMYELGILVPMGGILVVPAYISKRRSLSSTDEVASDEVANDDAVSDDTSSVDAGTGSSDTPGIESTTEGDVVSADSPTRVENN
ncbi:hypothetical protein C482_16673 [Natrialba chahannaoensis JCM 10990]|uniref:Uncharacterized protein n=1 Tax=Natrialba chahannaoensis JCM 10990 TaxID=1227492 RepID=M0AD69_9EURY|nr:hypothetical protein [Natrialba chahannaoensis]ELY95298.1 hypothetical protein C482_16673 [Natrialba chahannaoensis JCM 10990]